MHYFYWISILLTNVDMFITCSLMKYCKENATSLIKFQDCLISFEATDVNEDDNIKNLLQNESQLKSMFCIIKAIAENMETEILIITDDETEHKIPKVPIHFKTLTYNSNSKRETYQQLLNYKASSFYLILIFCHYQCSVEVLHLAWLAEFVHSEVYWVLVDITLSQIEVAMPKNTISIGFNNDFDIIPTINNMETPCSISLGYQRDYLSVLRIEDSPIPLPHIYIYDQKYAGWLKATEKSTFKIYLNNFLGQRNPLIPKFKIVIIQEEPFVMISVEKPRHLSQTCHFGTSCYSLVRNGSTTSKRYSCCFGYVIDLINILKVDLQLEFELYFVEDGSYGREVNGSWNGMVGELVQEKADIIAAPLTIFEARETVIDFTDPYMEGGYSILNTVEFKKSFFNVSILAHLTAELWLGIFLILFICCFTLCLMEKVVMKKYELTISESLLYLVGILFSHDLGGKNPNSLGSRTVTISFAVTMLIVMSTYTAIMTANKIIHPTDIPISGFRDEKILNPTEDFKFGTLADSTLTRGPDNEEWKRMNEFMKTYNFQNTNEAIEAIKQGKLQALISDKVIVEYYAALDRKCQLKVVDMIGDAGLALATRKGLEQLNKDLSYFIREYRSSDKMIKLKDRWFKKVCTIYDDKDTDEGLTLIEFGGLLLVMLSSAVVSILILVMENFIFVIRKKVYNVSG